MYTIEKFEDSKYYRFTEVEPLVDRLNHMIDKRLRLSIIYEDDVKQLIKEAEKDKRIGLVRRYEHELRKIGDVDCKFLKFTYARTTHVFALCNENATVEAFNKCLMMGDEWFRVKTVKAIKEEV